MDFVGETGIEDKPLSRYLVMIFTRGERPNLTALVNFVLAVWHVVPGSFDTGHPYVFVSRQHSTISFRIWNRWPFLTVIVVGILKKRKVLYFFWHVLPMFQDLFRVCSCSQGKLCSMHFAASAWDFFFSAMACSTVKTPRRLGVLGLPMSEYEWSGMEGGTKKRPQVVVLSFNWMFYMFLDFFNMKNSCCLFVWLSFQEKMCLVFPWQRSKSLSICGWIWTHQMDQIHRPQVADVFEVGLRIDTAVLETPFVAT